MFQLTNYGNTIADTYTISDLEWVVNTFCYVLYHCTNSTYCLCYICIQLFYKTFSYKFLIKSLFHRNYSSTISLALNNILFLTFSLNSLNCGVMPNPLSIITIAYAFASISALCRLYCSMSVSVELI